MTRRLDKQLDGRRGRGHVSHLAGLLPVVLFGLLLATGAPAQEIGGADDGWSTSEATYDYESVTLRTALWLDRSEGEVYGKGDLQTVGFQVNQDAYAVVYRIDTEGLVTVLWPRARLDDGFVFGGHEYLLPVSGSGQLRVSGAEGEGFVEAIISAYPFDLRDLELDFHHDQTGERYDTYVAGDPFLAINEVNYLVTGLEEATDFVVTDNINYYVHREVDHPRYLCSQCHVDDDVAYHPYRDQCRLDINVDYGAYNGWYEQYGYAPVYYNPIYVYVDPWIGSPWINFWYDPWYHCPPFYGYSCYRPAYAWCDSPYYGGGCWDYYDGGSRRYKPLGARQDDGVRRKTREYAQVSPMVADGRDPADPTRTKTDRPATVDSRRPGEDRITGIGGSANRSGYVGQSRRPQQRDATALTVRNTSQAGLRIRGDGTGDSRLRTGTRHTSGGSGSRPSLRQTRSGGDYGLGSNGSRLQSRSTDRSNAQGTNRNSGGSIRPVEPRKKGTRIWTSGHNRGTGQSSSDQSRVRSQPGTSSQRSSRGREAVKPRATTRSSSSGNTKGSSEVRKQSSPRRDSSPKRSSGGSSSGSVKPRSSNSGNSGGGGSSKSSGGSRGSSGGSRSGGSRGSSGKRSR